MTSPALLIIDDDPSIRTLVGRALGGEGRFKVEAGENGAQGLELLKEQEFDIVLLDINLPDHNGLDLLKEIKEKYPDTICAIITGNNSTSDAVRALVLGADDYFIKPFSLEEMTLRLNRSIKKKHLEKENARLNELPRVILNNIDAAVVIIDAGSLRITSANHIFLKQAGLRSDEVVGSPHRQILAAGQMAWLDEDDDSPIIKTIRTSERASRIQIVEGQAGGKTFLEITTSPIMGRDNQVDQVIVICRDITARHELELTRQEEKEKLEAAHQQLEEAYRSLKASQAQIVQQEKMASIGSLAAGVAHEINNPVGFISSNLGTLGKYLVKLQEFITLQDQIIKEFNDREAGERLRSARKRLKVDFIMEDIPELIEESLEGAERVKTIVQNLKSFARVDDLKPVATDINECINSTLNIVWNELKYKSKVIKDLGELVPVRCFPQQLNQVFMNILVNAAQAIEKQGEIRITSRLEDDQVVVSIADNGCGIPPENLQRIFEPFYTTKEVGKGTGLGMSISYGIIEKHHGTIEVTSTVGQGTTFFVRLPVMPEDQETNDSIKL